jgi:hypothetical protein
VKIFGWRVACDNLATMKNKFKRTLAIVSTCTLYGTEEESCFHAVVKCTKARALRLEMRNHWQLPPKRSFSYSDTDWLQILLMNAKHVQRSQILMLLWRS